MSVYQTYIEQLFDMLKRAADGLQKAGIDYRLVGGLAIFFHVDHLDPLAARFTRDIDLAIHRRDVAAVRAVLDPIGFRYHLVFINEKVRPEYLEPVPDSPAVTSLVLAPVSDLLLMKLTSFREKDRVHVRDMDAVGLITPKTKHC
jgi:hypothetical protein